MHSYAKRADKAAQGGCRHLWRINRPASSRCRAKNGTDRELTPGHRTVARDRRRRPEHNERPARQARTGNWVPLERARPAPGVHRRPTSRNLRELETARPGAVHRRDGAPRGRNFYNDLARPFGYPDARGPDPGTSTWRAKKQEAPEAAVARTTCWPGLAESAPEGYLPPTACARLADSGDDDPVVPPVGPGHTRACCGGSSSCRGLHRPGCEPPVMSPGVPACGGDQGRLAGAVQLRESYVFSAERAGGPQEEQSPTMRERRRGIPRSSNTNEWGPVMAQGR